MASIFLFVNGTLWGSSSLLRFGGSDFMGSLKVAQAASSAAEEAKRRSLTDVTNVTKAI
jgi:hypothetical protein